jgi:hypothetical protein
MGDLKHFPEKRERKTIKKIINLNKRSEQKKQTAMLGNLQFEETEGSIQKQQSRQVKVIFPSIEAETGCSTVFRQFFVC